MDKIIIRLGAVVLTEEPSETVHILVTLDDVPEGILELEVLEGVG